jgi:hypothetical protein
MMKGIDEWKCKVVFKLMRRNVYLLKADTRRGENAGDLSGSKTSEINVGVERQGGMLKQGNTPRV